MHEVRSGVAINAFAVNGSLVNWQRRKQTCYILFVCRGRAPEHAASRQHIKQGCYREDLRFPPVPRVD